MKKRNYNCVHAWLCEQETPTNLVAFSRKCAGCGRFKPVDKRLLIRFRGTRAELKEQIGIAFHTGFRKATDCPQSAVIWNKIQEMPEGAYEAVLDFVMDCI